MSEIQAAGFKTGPEQNICTPIDISCNPVFYTADPYSGSVAQPFGNQQCGFFFGQTTYYNYVFLQFTANETGFLRFTLTPNRSYSKYGYTVYDKSTITNCNTGANLLCSADSRTHPPVVAGPIGARNNPPCIFNGQNTCPWTPELPVTKGRQYVIFINYQNDGYVTDEGNVGEGFTFNASASTAGVFSNNIDFTVNTPAPVCSGQTTTLSAVNGAAGATYTWTGGGINKTGSSITVSPTVTTTYTVKATVGACVSTKTVTVTVTPSHILNIEGNTVVCNNAAGNLCASVTPTENTGTYTWSSNVANSFTNNPNPCGPVNVCTQQAPAWDPAKIYLGNTNGTVDIVSYNGRRYAALWWTQGQRPDLFTWCPPVGCAPLYDKMWKDLGPCFNGASGSQIDLTKSGTYSVTYTSANGCSVTGSKTVTVLDAITLTAATSKTKICKGQSAVLSVTGGVAGMVYTWTAAGGFSQTGSSVYVVPTITTTYTVTGTLAGSNCPAATSTVDVIVEQPLVLTATALPVVVCPGGSSVISVSGGNANTVYTWTGAGVNTTGTSITVTPSVTSTYQVSGVEPGSLCAASKTFATVTVETPVITLTATDVVCEAGTICANVTPVAAGGSFVWSSSVSNSFTVNPNSCGAIYTCNDPAWNPTAIYIAGAVVSYDGRRYQALWWTQGNPPNLYTWCPPAGCAPLYDKMWKDLGICGQGLTSSLIDVTKAATYTVQYTSPNGCTATASKSVNVVAKTLAVASNQATCGGPVTLTASGFPTGTTYTWTGPGSYTATGTSISVTQNGTYVVSATSAGCTAQGSATVAIAPQAKFLSHYSYVCPNGQPADVAAVFVLDKPSPWTGNVTYNWTVQQVSNITGATAGSGTTMIQTLSGLGSVTYSVTATIGNSDNTVFCTTPAVLVTVSANNCTPLPIIIYNEKAVRSGNSAVISWKATQDNKYLGHVFSIEKSPNAVSNWTVLSTISFNTSGNFIYSTNAPAATTYYRIRLLSGTTEKDASSIMVITGTARIGDETEEKVVVLEPSSSIGPNPTSTDFVLNAFDLNEGTVVVRSLLGDIVYSAKLDGSSTYTFGSTFPVGLYYVTVNSGSYVKVEKIIKE